MRYIMALKATSDVFGIAPDVVVDSYVDRGDLDNEIKRVLGRNTHIALRGESKSGKSWLRQKNISSALVFQCRLKTSVIDIYTGILSQLGIKLVVEETSKDTFKGKVESTASFGVELISKLKLKMGLEESNEQSSKLSSIGHDINDLKFIADLINESGRRVVIEDFHYLSLDERQKFSFDLKALWDYKCFFVIIGVWTKTNLLIFLNSDLSGRITEISVHWSEPELRMVLDKGSSVLKINICPDIKKNIVSDCYNNVGLLQQLTLMYLDDEGIYEEQSTETDLCNMGAFESAAMKFAEQLNTRFQKFAKDVSSGIRNRKDSTGIYAHAMAVVMAADDDDLINGYALDEIFRISNGRENRIQKGNLRTVLQKLEELQIDEAERGLVLAYNDATDEISAIDRTLLFYRKYVTVKWPWEDLIRECKSEDASTIIMNP